MAYPFLVDAERRFDVVGVRGDRLAQLRAVEHRQVRALAARRRQVRGVPQQRHPAHPVPSVVVRERVDHARDRPSVALGDQGGQRRRPPLELGRDARRRGGGVGEVDARDPLGGAVQRDMGVKHAPRLAAREDALSGRLREQRARADRRGGCGMPRVGVVPMGLDERGADVPRLGVRQQRPDFRPGAVRPDEQARGRARPVTEGQFEPPVAERPDIGDPAAPLDRPARQGVEQDPAQVAAQHLWAPTRAVVGLVEQHRAMPVQHARSLAARVDDRVESVGEAGRLQRQLPVVRMDVEMAALRAGNGLGWPRVAGGAFRYGAFRRKRCLSFDGPDWAHQCGFWYGRGRGRNACRFILGEQSTAKRPARHGFCDGGFERRRSRRASR
jgi:hypothetical protein